MLLFSGVIYTDFYYGFDFFGGDTFDDGIYKGGGIPEVGNATDINFTVKRADIYEISFIYAQDPQKQKEEEKLSEKAFPGYGCDEFTKRFCQKTTAANTMQGVLEPMNAGEDEKAAFAG